MFRASRSCSAIAFLVLVGGFAVAQQSQPVPADAIWNRLVAGNHRFVTGKTAAHDPAAERKALTNTQHPQVAVLSCSDSRVPPELVFDAGLGDLFVVRAAGEDDDPISIGSLEYAVEHLGSTVIVVMGHQRCGAVTAACSEGKSRIAQSRSGPCSHHSLVCQDRSHKTRKPRSCCSRPCAQGCPGNTLQQRGAKKEFCRREVIRYRGLLLSRQWRGNQAPLIAEKGLAMDTFLQMLSRGVDHLIGRFSGPLNFRLFIMPAVVTVLAIRAGLRDAREGQPPYLWGLVLKRRERRRLFRSGLKDVGKVFIVACRARHRIPDIRVTRVLSRSSDHRGRGMRHCALCTRPRPGNATGGSLQSEEEQSLPSRRLIRENAASPSELEMTKGLLLLSLS